MLPCLSSSIWQEARLGAKLDSAQRRHGAVATHVLSFDLVPVGCGGRGSYGCGGNGSCYAMATLG